MNFWKKLFGIEQKTEPEQPHSNSSLYPGRYGGGIAASGIAVNTDIALTLSAVWACVKRLSETIACMPIQMYERMENGSVPVPYDRHPLAYVLHDSPNYDMTAISFWRTMQVYVELQGNAYALKQMGGGRVRALHLMPPNRVSVRRLQDGRIQYRYSDGQRQGIYYDNDVLHIRGMTLDGIMGLSTIAYMRNTVGGGLAQENSSSEVFKNGLRPSGVMSYPHTLSAEQRQQIYESIERYKAAGSGGILVTGLGESFSPININPQDAQLLASRSWTVEEICRWFGVPPYLVGYTEKSTSWGTGMEQQNQNFLTYTILPRIREIEQAIEKTLLTPAERGRFFVRFNYEGLLRADSKTRAEVNAMDVRNGIRSRNEIREKENMRPYEGGDVYTVEANLTTVDSMIRGENRNGKTMVPDAGVDGYPSARGYL